MKRSTLILIGVLAATGGAGAGWWLVQPPAPHRHTLTRQTDAAGAIYYSCPMHPQVRQDGPGNCPICGMKLARVQAPEAPAAAQHVPEHVQVSAAMVQNLGLRVEVVTRGAHTGTLRAVGSVVVDQTRILAVQARSAGFVEQLRVRTAGEMVKRGQVLAAIYSPEVLAAQEELQLARRSGDAALIGAAETRLRLLGASPGSGSAPRQTLLRAPSDGVVLELTARENEQIAPGMPLMKLADLSRVWVEIEVPEAQAAALRVGQTAQVASQALGGRRFETQIAYIYPQLQAETRTLRARLVLDNPDLALRPGMYVEVTLAGEPGQSGLWVPSEAVIRTGTRDLVMLAEAEGRYRPAQVRIGREAGGYSEVLEGLREQESVVVSGQFLLDSEASLRGVAVRALAEAAP